MTHDVILRRLHETLAAQRLRDPTLGDVDVDVVNLARPSCLSAGDPLVQYMSRSIEAVTGRAPRAVGMQATSDSRWILLDAGIPVVNFSMGNTSGHGPNEWCGVDDLIDTVKVYAPLALLLLSEPRVRADKIAPSFTRVHSFVHSPQFSPMPLPFVPCDNLRLRTGAAVATVILSACVWPCLAQAQSTISVTTPSRRAQRLADAPGTTIVINKDDIRVRGYASLTDVLRDLPGMDIAENFFSVIGTQVGVRGIASSNKIVVLVDGMRVNPPGDDFFPLHSDISVRAAEQIEVSYGPNSALYGPDAASAIINIITKAPPAGGRPAVAAGADAGRHREREAWLSFGQAFGGDKIRKLTGYVQYHDSDLSRLDREFPALWREFAAVAAPKGRGTIPDRRDFGLNGFAQLQVGNLSLQTWYRESSRSSSEGVGGAALGFLPEARWADRSWVTEGRHTAKISDAVALESRVSYNWYQTLPQSRFVFEATPATWFLDDFKYADAYSVGADETLRAALSPTVSLLAGATYMHYDIIPKSTIPGGATPGSHDDIVRQGGEFVYYTEPGDPASRHAVPRVVDSEYRRYGAYVDVEWQVAPKLKAVAGIRLEKDSRVDARSSSPRIAVMHTLTDALAASYTYAEAYVSPSPYFNAPFDRGDILSVPNPNLKPEKARTHEVSVTYTTPAYRLGVSAYAGRQSSLILASDTTLPPTMVDRVFVDLAGTQPRELVQSVNSGASRTAGADLYGRAALARRLDTWFSYSYASYTESTAGLDFGLRGLSRHNVRLGATLAAGQKLSLTPSLVARSTPENLPASPLDAALRRPWAINLHVVYGAVQHMDLYAHLRNVTDHHYAVGGFVGAIPQEPFSGVVGARLSF